MHLSLQNAFNDPSKTFQEGVEILDGPIRANRFTASRGSPDSRESFQALPELNPFFCESRFAGLKIASRRFEAIRANRSHLMKIQAFLRIDSRAPICVANRRAMLSPYGFSKISHLRVMDICAENRGRPHQKVRFHAVPVMGRLRGPNWGLFLS